MTAYTCVLLVLLGVVVQCRVVDNIDGAGNLVTGLGGNMIKGYGNVVNAIDPHDKGFLASLVEPEKAEEEEWEESPEDGSE